MRNEPTVMTQEETRILLLAPTPTDAAISERILMQAGLPLTIVRDLASLCEETRRGAGALLITEEAVLDEKIEDLAELVRSQPVWSDLPVVLMVSGGSQSLASAFALEHLGNVLLLEYPVRVNNLVSTMRVALRDRRRQYETRRYQMELIAQAENLWRSNRELEQFAYVSSHDLKEPLRKILNYAQLLESRYKPILEGDGAKYIHMISDGAERMRNLIEGLLAFSRLAKPEQRTELVDLSKTVAEVINDLEMPITDRGAKIRVGPLPTVWANPLQMHQLFQNLIANAIKFCQECPEVRVSAEEDANAWTISVSDNGIGIEPAYREKIFNVFARLHTRGQYPGTGIGLAICKKIVETHSGRIWVESEEGGGSTFRFTLPKVVPGGMPGTGSRPAGADVEAAKNGGQLAVTIGAPPTGSSRSVDG